MRPHLCQRIQTSFVCLSLIRVPESRVNWGSGFLRGGKFIQWEGGKWEGCGFQKSRAFWAAG